MIADADELAGIGDRPAGADWHNLFVLPAATVHRHQGGGQRSAIIFAALSNLAPTTVVILGAMPADEADAAFPNAAAIVMLPEYDIAEEAANRLERATAFLRKYFLPTSFYRPLPGLRRRLEASLPASGRSLVVFRLFRTFAVADLRPQPSRGRHVIVDVDDRDDQKAQARLRALFGDRLVDTVLMRLAVQPLAKLFHAALRDVSGAWFVSEKDAALAGVPATLIENAPFVSPAPDDLTAPSAAQDIVFVGPAYFPPNANGMRWFLDACWPALSQRCPQARLRIVGGGNWRQIVEAAPSRDRIDVRGFVEDLTAEYRASRLAICPLNEGGGSKVKLVEACAYGRPVVATSHSARGFAPELTGHICQADSAERFVEACARLIEDPADADRRGRNLREVQQKLYSARAIREKIERTVRDLLRH